MKDKLISLELAKLAKEKGFKEYCTNAYINRQYLSEYHVADEYFKYTCKEDFPLVNDCAFFLVPRAEPWFAAPTQSLLQKWLRELHNIDVESRSVRFVGDEKVSYYQPYIYGSIVSLKRYNTYEESLEAGLFEGLNRMP
jgi:hypothetical protein